MTNQLRLSRLGAIVLLGLLALTPALASAQAQSNTPSASTPQATSPAGEMKMGQPMMMNGEKMKPEMDMMACNGKPCGPPNGAAGHTGSMMKPGSANPAADPATPANKHKTAE